MGKPLSMDFLTRVHSDSWRSSRVQKLIGMPGFKIKQLHSFLDMRSLIQIKLNLERIWLSSSGKKRMTGRIERKRDDEYC